MDQKYVDSPSKLDSQNSIFKMLEDRGSSQVSRHSRPFEKLSRAFEKFSSHDQQSL